MSAVQRALLEDHLSDAIYPRNGQIMVETYWEKEFAKAGIDIGLLVDCCDDMMFDYQGAIREYEKAVASTEHKHAK